MFRRWFPLLLAVAQLVAQPAPERASVEGVVVNQRTGAPLAGVQLKLFGGGSRIQAATDRKGHFIFSGLDTGQYHLQAERAGFVPLQWSRIVLTLAAGDQLKDLTVRLTPQAAISGALMDADGAPIANVHIQVLRHTWRDGKRVLAIAGGAQSNDAGEFRIGGLAAGDYLMRAQPRELAVPLGEDKIKRIYITTWYPGATEAVAAAALHLASGEERAGAVFSLRASTVVKVYGRVIMPTPKSETNSAGVMLMPADDFGLMDILRGAQANGPEGTFVIPDVPPGAYRIQAQLIDPAASRPALRNITSASQTIQVGDTDVEGISLSAPQPRIVTGLVKWDDKPPKDAGSCMVSLLVSDTLMTELPSTTTKADGAFSLEVPPDRFDLHVHCGAKGSYMKAASVGDTDILAAGIDGTAALPAGPLQVTMATGAGQIEGSVIDADSQPVGGATVAVIPDASKRASLFRSAITDQNGRFKLSDIIPGAYSLYAWDQIEDEEWRNEEFIKKYDDRRTRVQLDTGGRQALQLQIVKVE